MVDVWEDRRIDAQSLTLTLAMVHTLCIAPSPRAQSKDCSRSQRAGFVADSQIGKYQMHWWHYKLAVLESSTL